MATRCSAYRDGFDSAFKDAMKGRIYAFSTQIFYKTLGGVFREFLINAVKQGNLIKKKRCYTVI
jgi:hypothetical protein